MAITWNRLHQLVKYDADTGIFTRNGKKIGTVLANGYLQARIDVDKYLLHRVAWFYVYGEWPVEIDHRDGVKANNALSNLRNCTHAENQQNMVATGNCKNTSGYAGVSWHKHRKCWVATITHKNKTKTIGSFDSLEAAATARAEAKAKLHTFNPESHA